MRPESVEVKVTVAGWQVAAAVGTLRLTGGKDRRIVFCEDVTAGLAPSAPLLDSGVVLRIRARSGSSGDSTVKLRPCRWSQLTEDFFTNHDDAGGKLTIEADWAGPGRVLSASMTADWADDRLAAVRTGALPVAGLFTDRQRRFLERCARSRVNLSAVSALGEIAATRWDAFPVDNGGARLSVRAERWVVGGELDFLELSIVSSAEAAPRDQAALAYFVADRGLVAEDSNENKTQRVLTTLVRRALDPPA